MNKKNVKTVKLIFAVYLAVTLALLCFGYAVQAPATAQQEFPFTVTYSFDGETRTISDLYVAEYTPGPMYLEDDGVAWFGYVKDRNRLEADYYNVGEADGYSFSINLNLEPGFLMGDPRYADAQCVPTALAIGMVGEEEIRITDPAELEELGISIVSWEYPHPIENTFSFGGFSLSSEAAVLTAAIAILALLACMILVRKDRELVYGLVDKCSIVLNFLVAIFVFPFILAFSVLSEIVADVSVVQQMLYLSPALTVLGLAASLVLRRMGYGKRSLVAQLIGPVILAILLATGMAG